MREPRAREANDPTARRAEPGRGPRSGSRSGLPHWRGRDRGPTLWPDVGTGGCARRAPAPLSQPRPSAWLAHAGPGSLCLYPSFYSTNFDLSLRSISPSSLNCPVLSAGVGGGGQCLRAWGDGTHGRPGEAPALFAPSHAPPDLCFLSSFRHIQEPVWDKLNEDMESVRKGRKAFSKGQRHSSHYSCPQEIFC